MNIDELYKIYLRYPSIQTDTRKLKKGDLFFSLRGANFNGNEFAEKALDEGAEFAIIDDERFSVPGKTILVEDALKTLQILYQFPICPSTILSGSSGWLFFQSGS